MNYDDRVKDLFTLAHELGHSIHSHISNRSQPHIQADYPILIGEVASNVNEALLSAHLLEEWKERGERAYLINHELEEMRTSVFRQCLFAEFECRISSLVDSGEPLTKDLLCDLYGSLNREYYGPELVVDGPLCMEWARIPHFYFDFYVYKYVTGYCSARSIAKRVLEGDDAAKEGYLGLLRSGGSVPPLEALRGAGVDLERPDPIHEALSSMGKMVADLQSSLRNAQ
jgi:oligoendopeptidase F